MFHAHQPVYVTADSLPYAWHTSYDAILEQVERALLMEELGALMDTVSDRVGAHDVDLRAYLDVARSLLRVGTASPRMLVVKLDHDRGENATTYRGFVSTYAERITSGFARYSDEQWRAEIAVHAPERPEWMSDITR